MKYEYTVTSVTYCLPTGNVPTTWCYYQPPRCLSTVAYLGIFRIMCRRLYFNQIKSPSGIVQ